jgi:hypothetical protein
MRFEHFNGKKREKKGGKRNKEGTKGKEKIK